MSPARRVRHLAVGFGLLSIACGLRDSVPPTHAVDARFGRLGGSGPKPSPEAMCRRWDELVASRDAWAGSHVSFPEADRERSCFTPIFHDGRRVHAPAPPRACAYPDEASRIKLEALAAAMDAFAKRDGETNRLFPCALGPAQRRAVGLQNARVLRALAARSETHPYAAVVVLGHGSREQDATALAAFSPGDACLPMPARDLARLRAMPARSARAGDAIRGGVAPLVVASGGAIQSRSIEAFALMHLLVCKEGVPEDRVLLEPCAEHTHTNLRNAGRWIHAIGGRAAYVVTDDGLQAEYLQDFSGFELLLGSVDQRSLRDWGYVVGSWRQASAGVAAGFWFTPYRFWAEPRDALGSVTCVDAP